MNVWVIAVPAAIGVAVAWRAFWRKDDQWWLYLLALAGVLVTAYFSGDFG